MFVAKRVFLTKGVGRHREKLTSFEMALRNAWIADQNLVRVSSIFPPHCKIIPRKDGARKLKSGAVTFVVMSENATNEPHRLIAASVGVAIPKNSSTYGYLSEHHSYGQTEKVAGDYAEDLAAGMLATTLGVELNYDKSYDERKEQWKISGQIVRTLNISQTAVGDKNGLWTTVIASCILLPPED
jgi:arginine decarboxylase